MENTPKGTVSKRVVGGQRPVEADKPLQLQIADFRFHIADFTLAIVSIYNPKSSICNQYGPIIPPMWREAGCLELSAPFPRMLSICAVTAAACARQSAAYWRALAASRSTMW